MNWIQLLSLKRFGDTQKRPRAAQDETRLGFDVDFDRIIFSSAFRSLQDKTQVIPLSETDFVHTRLTHSLEVSVVGRTLGRRVGKVLLERHPKLQELGYTFNDFGAIVAAASVTHDIGNPPFGHSGEKAIGEYFKSGKGAKYKEQLSVKEYQDLIDFFISQWVFIFSVRATSLIIIFCAPYDLSIEWQYITILVAYDVINKEYYDVTLAIIYIMSW